MKKLVLKILVFYKKHLSKRGLYCRFVPTCSEYTYEAVQKYGAAKGLFLGIKRILKCNPWHKGGIDLVK